jgi:UDP-N-acetylmuramoyl-tripeptide--D-alanyl-D-alanine ligase
MKSLIKKIIAWKLGIIAKMYLRFYKPQIVAITGNVGKTSTKEAVAVVLSRVKRVRSGKGNLNNEFGVPLTIVGDWADDYYETGNALFFWIRVLTVSFFRLFFQRNYPEVLVLE